MRSEPISIPGVNGPVTMERRPFRPLRIEVDGREVETSGKEVLLPTEGRLGKRARIKFARDPLPALEVDGVTYKFGPHNPWWLRGLAWLPLIWVAVGLAGAVAACVGFLATASVLATRFDTHAKLVAVTGICALTFPLAWVFGLSPAAMLVSLTGEGPLSPRQVGHGDCVAVEHRGESTKILRHVDCESPFEGIVVAVGTGGSWATTGTTQLGVDAYCQRAGSLWLSVVDSVPLDLSMAVEYIDPDHPSAAGSYACLAERGDGARWTTEFDAVRPN